ncbi:hypothetical protein BGZ96_004369 [Linnemannia gamsii]|uniref:Uncharacterized protein n=1 Tax=Linnemannia gamsii TaxID=64522 RepID=A0ABQ7K7A4_9FUNG|nr:hypothetical protein BGZ96_004369 [Linnemannia gamsii]
MADASILKHLQITTLGHMEDDGVLELLTTGGLNTVAMLSSQAWGCKDIEMLDLEIEIMFKQENVIRVLEEMVEAEWEFIQYKTRHRAYPWVIGSPDLLREYFGLIQGMSKLHSV